MWQKRLILDFLSIFGCAKCSALLLFLIHFAISGGQKIRLSSYETNEFISNSPIIKGLVDGGLSLIPIVGQAISSSLDARSFKLFEENTKKFTNELKSLIANLDEKKIDKDFLESPEFTSLLIETLACNARTYESEKVKLYAKIFTNYLTSTGSHITYKEGFIRILDELTVNHIRILAFICHRIDNPNEENEKLRDRVLAEDISSNLIVPIDRVLAYCQHLLRFGLIWDWGIGKLGEYKPNKFSITNYGRELANLLKSINNSKDTP